LWVGIGFGVAYKRDNLAWALLGLLGLIGLIVLACLPDQKGRRLRRIRALLEEADYSELRGGPPASERPPRRDRPPLRRSASSGSRTALILAAVLGTLLVVVAVGGVVLLLARSRRIPDSEWALFTPPGGRCSVAFPGQPVRSDLTIQAVRLIKYTLERKRDGIAFSVGYFDAPGPAAP